MTKKSMILMAVVFIAVIILVVINFISSPGTIKKQPVSQPEIVNNPENIITVTYPGTVEFISSGLGIAFNYIPQFEDLKFITLEKDNRVYVYESKLKPEIGQFVQVFQKDPEDSLSEAVRKKFLAAKSSDECFVVDSQVVFPNYPASFQAVEISFPKPIDDREPWWSRGDACSSDYAQTNGIRYFLGDTNHPDKFLFFDIGQYSIKAGEDLTWQDTIRFLD